MAISRERFDQGMTPEQYKAQMTQNQEKFIANEANVSLRPADLAFFKALPEPINALILTEDWCGDALVNVPVLMAIAQQTGKLNLRFFLRDKNLDLADQYLKEGKYRSVPVFVFFDHDMRELGHFIERPAQATVEMQAATDALAAAHPDLPDIAGSFEAMGDDAKRLRLRSLSALRRERGAAWSEMLLDEIERLLSAAQPSAHQAAS